MAAANEKSAHDLEKPLCFSIPLPGGRVARIPQEVVEKYVVADARAAHAPSPQTTSPQTASLHTSAPASGGQPKTTTIHAGESMITINIYTGTGEVTIDEADDDVVAHSLSVDQATGMSEWHTDWEFGECEYTDETGFPQRIQAWHRHPFGTEYSEIYDG